MSRDRPPAHSEPAAALRLDGAAPVSSQLWRLPTWLLGRLWRVLLAWQDRATSRHRLSLMTEHELKDIGVTRIDVEGEINKPFWRG